MIYAIAFGLACLAITAPSPLETAANAAATLPLRQVVDLPLTGRSSRFDYQSFDPTLHRLYIAHMGDGTLTVVDTESQRVVANLPGFSDVHGVLVVPERGMVYATVTGKDEVAVLDPRNLQVVARIPAGTYPDGLAYAPQVHKLYVSDESGRTDTVIDVDHNRRVATIPLGGEVGNSQYDPVSRHIFVNVQTAGQLVEIDPATDRIVGRHPLPGAVGNHGLLIDAKARLAFIACEGNAKLLVVDIRTMRVLSAHVTGGGPDVLAFDPGLNLLYVASESGVVAVFRETPQGVKELGAGFVAPGAHTVAVDPQTHRVYLPLPDVEGHPVLRVMLPIL
jgi:YVTN family beta-propeller protein